MDHQKKEDYLINKILPFNVREVSNVDDVLRALTFCGFQGKKLGIALDVLFEMVSDQDCLKILTLSGAMVPAGMGELICVLIRQRDEI